MRPTLLLRKAVLVFTVLPVLGTAYATDKATVTHSADHAYIERGRYLVKIGGCNDCHTPRYPETGGNVPEKQWLTGDQLGWRGPWGTTYPANLRQYMHGISENEWVKIAHTKQMRPPMPWFALRDMTKDDLKSIYRFVRHLGPDMTPVPTFVPPNEKPKGPFVQFPDPPR